MKRIIRASQDEVLQLEDGYYVRYEWSDETGQFIWTIYNPDHRICTGGTSNKYDNMIRNCEAYMRMNKSKRN